MNIYIQIIGTILSWYCLGWCLHRAGKAADDKKWLGVIVYNGLAALYFLAINVILTTR